MAMAPSHLVNAAVARASAILASDPPAAQREAEAILKIDPRDPRALLVLASARRRQGDAAAALAILEPLAKTWPNAVHTRYELGVTLAAQGQAARAKTALEAAVKLKPDLAEAWRALGQLLFAEGDNRAAEAAFAAHDRAMVRDPALAPAAEALYGGRPEEAERRLRDLVLTRPNDAAALRLLAEARVRLGRHRDAETLLEHALSLEPAHEGARFAYASALFEQQKGEAAAAALQPLLAKHPAEPAYLNLLAGCLTLRGDMEQVVSIYEGLAAAYPGQPKVWLNYGHALRIIGRRDEAVAAYRRCMALVPDYGEAWWGLADLKVAAFEAEEVQAMQALVGRADLPPDDRLHLHYALGKAMEDRADYAASFEHYAAGAALRRAAAPYDADETSRHAQAAIALYTPAFLAEREGFGCPSDEPIFILGLPRSGSTLIEQILASHSQVEGTMELPNIGLIARDLGWPDRLEGLEPQALRALGERYLAETQVHRKLGRRAFVDKRPVNFQHLGLIHLILPKARIIDARRHPMGACFSAFKQHFALGQGFSYDLTDLGRYYADYAALMAHFDAVLPGRVTRVIYEDMVEDTEGQVRRLLEQCGLPFEEACLRFWETDRSVRTVSSEQVRRPIFRGGLDQWRRYEPWLDPLKTALGPWLDHWRD